MNKIVLAAWATAAIIGMPAIAQMATPHESVGTRTQAEAKVRARFAMIDANKDGYVTREEAEGARDRLRETMRNRIFAALDADKNGAISRAEFDSPRPGRPARGEGRRGGPRMGRTWSGRMFDRADIDKDGRVAEREAIDLAMKWFDRADADRDGTLTPEERRSARQAMREAWRARAGS